MQNLQVLQPTLKLSHKALLLVLLPLILDIGLLGVLLNFAVNSERLAQDSEHSRQLRAQANAIFEHLTEAAVALSSNTKSHLVLGYKSIPPQIRQDVERFKMLSKDDAQEKEIAEKVENISDRILIALEEDRHRLENNGPDFTIGMHQVRQQLSVLLLYLKETIEKLDPSQRHQDLSAAAALYRDQLKKAIIVGFVCNVLLALSLTVYFNRGTARRLNTLMKNTLSLAQGKELAPPLGGQDEIGQLDSTFHEMARALKEAADKERAIVTYASDVICSFAPSGKCVDINPACKRIWGYEPEELIGTDIMALIAENDRSAITETIQTIQQSGTPGDLEARTLRKDGTISETLWSLFWSEKHTLVVAVVHDISARKETERLKAEFTAMITHDLRSPLATMHTFLDLVTSDFWGKTPPDELRQAEKIQRLLDRLLSLIDEILSYERMDAGETVLELEDVDMAAIISDATDAVSASANENSIKILFDSPTSNVVADRSQLTRVLTNLLANAIKYSPKNDTISISTTNSQENVTVEISDHGQGVDDAQKPLIFEKYKQAPSAQKKQGTGLGLAICKKIVELHGGQIGVKDGKEGGSVFWFTLPRQPLCHTDDKIESHSAVGV